MAKARKFTNFLLEEEGPIAIFTSNRPEVMNALDVISHQEIIDFVAYYEQAEHLRVAIITGAGEKAFVAGADITTVRAAKGIPSLIGGKMRKGLSMLENCHKPIIAAINGYAFGGGLELALACDIRIVSDNALMALPETDLGILPGTGGTQRLPRIVGVGVAKDMILGGRRLNAQEAVQFGLAYKSVPVEQLMDETKKIAGKMALRGPVALHLAKKTINQSLFTDLKTGIEYESLSLAVLFESEDKAEGTTAFLEKRKPQFSGK